MRQRANELLLAMILSCYGVITVGGGALHAFFGFDHVMARLDSGGGRAPVRADQDAAAHECPICHFQAQGQIVADAGLYACIDAIQIRPCDNPPLTIPPAVHRPSIPRAPPSV